MLEYLPFVVCVVLQYHFKDPLPWYIWLFSVAAGFSPNVVTIRQKSV